MVVEYRQLKKENIGFVLFRQTNETFYYVSLTSESNQEHIKMGQVLRKLQMHGAEKVDDDAIIPVKFPNLSELPPELSLCVLSHLDATDLCLASCVWQDLGSDDLLWMRFVKFYLTLFLKKSSVALSTY